MRAAVQSIGLVKPSNALASRKFDDLMEGLSQEPRFEGQSQDVALYGDLPAEPAGLMILKDLAQRSVIELGQNRRNGLIV